MYIMEYFLGCRCIQKSDVFPIIYLGTLVWNLLFRSNRAVAFEAAAHGKTLLRSDDDGHSVISRLDRFGKRARQPAIVKVEMHVRQDGTTRFEPLDPGKGL